MYLEHSFRCGVRDSSYRGFFFVGGWREEARGSLTSGFQLPGLIFCRGVARGSLTLPTTDAVVFSFRVCFEVT